MASRSPLSIRQKQPFPKPQLQPFTYYPLPTSPPTIRLLRFQRPIPHGPILAWLEPFPLPLQHRDSSIPSPLTYNAVSYVWGPKTYSHSICINGCPFPILDSLYPIIETICADEGLRRGWWWIDSICINQGEGRDAEVERGSQVAMFRDVYVGAEMVVGWLGNDEGYGEEGIRFLRKLVGERGRLEKQQEACEKGELRGGRVLGEELEDKKGWAAVEGLFLRTWWERVWTLQEFVVPERFRFHCGRESIDREEMKMAVHCVYLCQKIDATLISKQASERAWIRRRLLMWHRKGSMGGLSMHLVGLMAYVGDYKATDPRDRIYSLLGLVSDGDLIGRPDYDNDVGKVYTKLVEKFVERYRSLDIICLADRFNKDVVKPYYGEQLPSWCPDWRAEVLPWVMPAMACQSSGKIGSFMPTGLSLNRLEKPTAYTTGIHKQGFTVKFSNSRRILSCQGIFLDFVDGIGGLKLARQKDHDGNEREHTYKIIQSRSGRNIPQEENTSPIVKKRLWPETASVIMGYVMRCLMLDRTDRYLNEKLPDGYCHYHLRELCLEALRDPKAVDPAFLDWFQRNRDLYIQGHSFQEVCKKSERLDSDQDGGLPDRNGFLSRFKDTTQWMSRRLMTTRDGNFGMVPCRAQTGDQIWALLGCSIPVLLRKYREDNTYELIGECYLNDFMKGEAFKLLRTDKKVRIENVQLS